MNLILIIVALVVAVLVITFIFVFKVIAKVQEANKEYKIFADTYGYQFDIAQGTIGYRDYSTHKTKKVINLKIIDNPYIEQYANLHSYPFGRGAYIKVAYVISGNYHGVPFRAFTYEFTGSTIENSGPGGTFSIVMIERAIKPMIELPKNIFFEDGVLCEYLKGNLDVDTLHERIKKLNRM